MTTTTELKVLPLGTKVEVVGYNSFFQGLMGTVQGYTADQHIVAIDNGEDFVHSFMELDKRTSKGSYLFPEDCLKELDAHTDTTVMRVNPPRC